MRIVSGKWKGKALTAPAGEGTRPTSDRARQAIFNILEHAPWAIPLAGAKVLDLFAGTGALGLEALSRGAAHCLFVDTDPAARAALATNIEACTAQGISRVWKRDATDLGAMPASANGPFDLVFLDPPYAKGLDQAALEGLRQGWVQAQTVLVLERGRSEGPFRQDGYQIIDSRHYGAAEVVFLKLEAEA